MPKAKKEKHVGMGTGIFRDMTGRDIRAYIDEFCDVQPGGDSDDNPGVVVLDGLDDALVGLAYSPVHQCDVAVYSVARIVQLYMDIDGMDEEEALEFFEYNVLGAYMGRATPVYILDR